MELLECNPEQGNGHQDVNDDHAGYQNLVFTVADKAVNGNCARQGKNYNKKIKDDAGQPAADIGNEFS